MRVLTLNFWGIAEPLAERMAVTRAGLTAMAPDVVALQEIVVRDDLDEGAVLFAGTPYSRVFGAAFRWDDEGRMRPHDHGGSGFGNLIASVWPIVRSEVRSLPGHEGIEPRAALAALLETPSGLLPVVTTHLDWEFDL